MILQPHQFFLTVATPPVDPLPQEMPAWPPLVAVLPWIAAVEHTQRIGGAGTDGDSSAIRSCRVGGKGKAAERARLADGVLKSPPP